MSSIRRVAIVGAGNAGVTAAKYLLAERRFTKIDIFEQRDCVGGLWNYTPENDRESSFSIPQTTADAPLEEPIWRDAGSQHITNRDTCNGNSVNRQQINISTKEPTFVSPMYEKLEANLPKSIMAHCDEPFPDDCQLFPSHEACLKYLERYADDVRHLIHFTTQIRHIQQKPPNPKTNTNDTTWTLTSQDLHTTNTAQHTYDALLIASGHFTTPFVPAIPGLTEWNTIHPTTFSHSKFFRHPRDYTRKKVLTIGRGYSGLDIASQIAPYCKQPLLISTRQPGELPLNAPFTQHPEITSLDPLTRTAYFADGTSASGIDYILFCTGYLYSYPFLPAGSLLEEKTAPIWTPDGARPHNLYQYIFYNADPSLAFLSIPQQIVPFPVVDAQAAVVARVWAGRLDLPGREELEEWEEETVRERGEGKGWLWLKPPLDGRYLNGLAGWCDGARVGELVDGTLVPVGDEGQCRVNGVAGQGGKEMVHGKEPARWGEKEIWVRERILGIKKAFVALGEGRHQVRTIEELGFDFEELKAEQTVE